MKSDCGERAEHERRNPTSIGADYPGLCSINAVKSLLKQLSRCFVAKDLRGQSIYTVSKKANVISRVIFYAFAFRNETPKHSVMAFDRSSPKRRMRMSKIYLGFSVFRQWKIGKFRAIVCSYCLKHRTVYWRNPIVSKTWYFLALLWRCSLYICSQTVALYRFTFPLYKSMVPRPISFLTVLYAWQFYMLTSRLSGELRCRAVYNAPSENKSYFWQNKRYNLCLCRWL